MFENLNILSRQGKGLFWVLLLCTLLVIVAMQITGAPLVNEIAPAGIVSFEFAGSLAGSLEIMNSWQGAPMAWARINMGLDFLFLTCYGLTIAMACLLLSLSAADNWQGFKQLGEWMALAVIVAAGLDIIENLALIALLSGWHHNVLPFLAKWCAIPKFILVGISLLYVMVGFVLVNLPKVRNLRKV